MKMNYLKLAEILGAIIGYVIKLGFIIFMVKLAIDYFKKG